VITVHTTSDLPPASAATITFQAQVEAGIPAGEIISNGIELTDQLMSYTIAPAEIPIDSYYGVSLAPSPVAKSGKPGSLVTYTLQLTNTGNVTDTITLESTPALWGVTLPFTQTTLAAFSSLDLLIQVLVPVDAQAGEFDVVSITAASLGDPTATDASELTTTAESVFGFIFIPATDAKSGVVGTVVDYSLHLTNTSNITETFTITFSGNVWDVSVDVSQVDLSAGTGVDINVQVSIPPTATNQETDAVTITVVSGQEEEDSAVLTTTAVEMRVFLPVVYQNKE